MIPFNYRTLLTLLLGLNWFLLFPQHTLKLKQTGKVEVQYNVNDIQLAFDVGELVGSVFRGMGNRPVPCVLPASAEQDILSFFVKNDTLPPITVRISSLQVSERIFNSSERAYCTMHFEILQEKDGSWYRIYDYTGIVYNGGMDDSTNDHDANMAKCFQQGFDRLLHSPAARSYKAVPINTPYAQPYLSPSKLGQGYFETVMDMRENNFTAAESITLTPAQAPANMKLYKFRSRPVPKENPFMLCANNQLYISIGKRYTPIIIKDSSYFMDSFTQGGMDSGALAAGLLGGLVGVAIYAASSDPKVPAPIERMKIDLVTGKLHFAGDEFLEEESTKNLPEKKTVILKHSFFSKAKEGIHAKFENGELYFLPRDEHLKAFLTSFSDSTQVTFQSEEGEVLGSVVFSSSSKVEVVVVSLKSKGLIIDDQKGPAKSSIIADAENSRAVIID